METTFGPADVAALEGPVDAEPATPVDAEPDSDSVDDGAAGRGDADVASPETADGAEPIDDAWPDDARPDNARPDDELAQLDDEFSATCDCVRESVVAVAGRDAPIGGGVARAVEGGSGFVISDEGHILTSTLNVDDSATEVRVQFADGGRETARVVQRDPLNGCVLLKVDVDDDAATPEGEGDRDADADAEVGEARTFTPVEFGDSQALEPGQRCFNFGNPWSSIVNDFEVAASAGTISSVYRPEAPRSGSNLRHYIGDYRGQIIESTCAINDGSWGGPLTDRQGRVIGMVVKLVSYNSWLGGAVPIHQIELVLDRLKAGRANPGSYHGMAWEASGHEDYPDAVRLSIVDQDSPADDAGLRVGDIVLRVDGETIDDSTDQCDSLFGVLPAGTTVALTILRGRQRMVEELTLALDE